MEPFTATPLLLAHAFSYGPHPTDHAPLRRALGARAGVEGFAAAAVWQRVPHLTLAPADDDEDSGKPKERFRRYLPVGKPHSTRDDVDTVVLYDRDHVEELGRLCPYSDEQDVPRRCQTLVVHLASMANADEMRTHNAVKKCSPSSLVIPADSLSSQPVRDKWTLQNCFLEGRDSLKSVDLRGLRGLHKVGHMVLQLCKNLTQVNLSSFTGVTVIGCDFLANCPALTSVDLSAFTEVKVIGSSFLAECSALTRLDLRPLAKLGAVGHDFAAQCVSLTSVELSQRNLVFFRENGFQGCTRLDFIDTVSYVGLVLWNYKRIAQREVDDDESLDREVVKKATADTIAELELFATETRQHELNVQVTHDLRKLSELRGGFCAWTGLRRLDLTALFVLQSIGDDVALDCPQLEVVTHSPKWSG